MKNRGNLLEKLLKIYLDELKKAKERLDLEAQTQLEKEIDLVKKEIKKKG